MFDRQHATDATDATDAIDAIDISPEPDNGFQWKNI
jgi:hypothetical protein